MRETVAALRVSLHGAEQRAQTAEAMASLAAAELTWTEDDGVTATDEATQRLVIACELACTDDQLVLSVRATFYGAWRCAHTAASAHALPRLSPRSPFGLHPTTHHLPSSVHATFRVRQAGL